MGSNGGYIGYDATPTPGQPIRGVWGMRDVYLHTLRGSWSGNDPDFASVVALLHFNGADGSTTFTDIKGHPFTANGNAQIDTAQSLFGGASGLFDGSGDYVSAPDSADWDFGTGDFTIEVAVRFASLPVNSVVTLMAAYGGSSTGWLVQYRTDAGLGNRVTFGPTGDSPLFDFAWSPSIDTWYRLAITRSGTSLRAFIDGAQIGSTQTSSHNISSTAALYMGAINLNLQYFNGWLDELRITKGVARYTANYTVATGPFLDR